MTLESQYQSSMVMELTVPKALSALHFSNGVLTKFPTKVSVLISRLITSMNDLTFVIPAFMNAIKSTIGSLTNIGIYGLFGLGFNDPKASVISENVQAAYGPDATWGNSVLTNIFSQNTSTPNFIAIDLARSEDYEEIDGGAFTIGEYDPEYAAVANSPKVPVFPADSTRWSILLEDITVNGQSISLDGYANPKGGSPSGKLNALLDTGAPTVGLPRKVIAAIYGAIEGSEYDSSIDLWLVPCKATVDLEVTFGYVL